MKRFIHLILLTFIFIGCENAFRDELQELHSEIDELRTMIAQTNSNIEALQTIVNALQDNDFVTSVMPVTDNGLTVGYTITFSKSGAITIYHGKDGYTPVIGVRKDADGVYCWTLDGEWMLDEEGKRIPTTGKDGEDGVIPIMKIEKDYWHVSYDNGATWTRLDKAVGEDGKDGDAMFSNVDVADTDYVIFTLADGTQVKIPTWKAFEGLQAEVNKMNTNLEALQTIVNALQDNDYVTSVMPVTDNGLTVGYTITFSKSGTITIYHGKDGYTPVIGVREDADGVYCWTLDGEWMLDEEGKRIPTTGTDGEDGVIPIMKIEEDYWHVSYDNGATWTRLDKAVGEDGKDGDAMFSNVDVADTDYVIFTLADGTQVKIPTWKAFEGLQAEVNKMNTNLEALQTIVNALQDNDYVTSVMPVTDNGLTVGYTITFSKSGAITIYHGKDGYTPVIGVRKDADGVYCWTLDGEWMLDEEGKRIPTTGTDGEDGVTPIMKIEEEYWHVSYDNGATWTRLDKAVGEDGKDGDAMFKEVLSDDRQVTLVLSDGTEIIIPCKVCFELILDTAGDETGALPGRQIRIKYTIANAATPTTVTASSDGKYSVSVVQETETEGYILIDCPLSYKDGYVNIIACDQTGYTVLRVINFYEEKMEFNAGFEYHIPAEGGSVTIPFRSNFEYRMEVAQDASSWLTLIQTKAPEMHEGEIVVSASLNSDFSMRTGKIYIYPVNSPHEEYTVITINQASAEFRLSQSKYAVPKEETVLTTDIFSTQGLTVAIKPGCDWLQSQIKSENGYDYTLETIIQKNGTNARRNTAISLYSGNGEILLGTIEVVQVSSDEEDPNAMIFKVRPNFINEFIVDLPLDGKYDCYVDWGDGTIEYCLHSEKPDVTHIYETSNPDTYIVKIVGDVPSLNSGRVKSHSIKEVVQWGNTGLKSMSRAFAGNYLLEKIPGDDSGAFSSVTDMSSAFKSCSSLISIPENLLHNCSSSLVITSIFSECSRLTKIPDNLFIKQTETELFLAIFSGCKNLKTIPDALFRNNTNATSFSEAFRDCTALEEIPVNLFKNCPLIETFYLTFHSCRNLRKVPISIFDNNRRVVDFHATFAYCSLEGESPYTEINGVKYHLYERHLASDYFYAPISYISCFCGCPLTDGEAISKYGW